MVSDVFSGKELSKYFEEINSNIEKLIHQEKDDYILNVNRNSYMDFLVNSFVVEVPQIDFDDLFIKPPSEKEIYDGIYPMSLLPRSRTIEIIVYHIPFTGNESLLRYRPNKFYSWEPETYIKDGHICFDVHKSYSEQIKEEAKRSINVLKGLYETFSSEIEQYNSNLKNFIDRVFDNRKQKILDNNDLLESLDVPIKKNTNLPETYEIPTQKIRKNLKIKPEVNEKGYTAEPKLNDSTYFEILQIIHDFGKVFERLPATYNEKREEELRDHLLLYLEPRFGETTGETFNKTGKTDILIRHENSNIFIAECKFWNGEKSYLDTISQLINYLTWRDSKAAVIIFVRNKKISNVLSTVKKVTPHHSNYIGHVDDKDESWFNYRFHIKDDPNREIKLAVLLFHIPNFC